MFSFRQFSVAHDRCAMKVGTDGVLLGAWASLPTSDTCLPHILDVGTGTGLIALMLAQRCPAAAIDAIDIVPDAVSQADENFVRSPWANRLSVHLCALQDYNPSTRYQRIVSNPPYFVNSLKNPDKARETARHTDTLLYCDLIAHSARLLTDDGHLCLILPIEAESEIISLAAEHHLHPTRICYVRTTPRKAPKRILLDLSHTPIGSISSPDDHSPEIPIPELTTLTLMGEHNEPRSEDYASLCRDFYL